MHYERKSKILDYMRTAQASTDAAVELDIPLQSVWKYLREMQVTGHVEKIGDSYNALYKATGKRLYREEASAVKRTKGVTICGVQF
jgi:predicted transcriptional regulator